MRVDGYSHNEHKKRDLQVSKWEWNKLKREARAG
jgi:hypothetical protein